MSFVVAGISWIGSKSTRNKGRRTKGATALHWGRGKAPLGECWAPALRRAGAQVHACNPFSSQKEVKMSSWTLSHLRVLTRHLSKHRKFCLSQLWPDSLSEPCSQPQPKPQTVSAGFCCVSTLLPFSPLYSQGFPPNTRITACSEYPLPLNSS